jgi:hypothetical protein
MAAALVITRLLLRCQTSSAEQVSWPWSSKARPMRFLGLRCPQSGLRSAIAPRRPDDRSEP